MTQTIVAIYDDIVVARLIVEDLVKADFARNSISMIINDAQNQYSRYLSEEYTPREVAVTIGEGASVGAEVGALTRLLVGAAALVVPGIGLTIIAGPIAAGLTMVVADAVTSGIVGALVKSGVPEDEAPYYAEGVRRGGTLISVQTFDALNASGIMNRHGSMNIHERSTQWRQAGWKGFDVGEKAKSAEMRTAVTADTTTTRITHMTHNADPITIVPASKPIVEPDPQFDDEDTEILLRKDVIATTTAEPIFPLPSTSDVTEVAPVPPVLEEDLSREYVYTGDDFQAIEAIIDPSNG